MTGGEFISGLFSPIWRWRAHVHTYSRVIGVPVSSLNRDLERLGWEHRGFR